MKGLQINSALQHHMVSVQQSPMFKSRCPKIGMYDAEEKRLRQLHGERPNAQFKVRLNNEILDARIGHSIKAS